MFNIKVMNLRSGTFMKFDYQPKKKTERKKSTAPDARSMAEKNEIKQLFAELKETFAKEFKELKDELKDFRQETERDIRTIMQQTADLKQKLDSTITRVDQLEARVSILDDAEIESQATSKLVRIRIDELVDQMEYMENKTRQNNICIYNIVEKSEGNDVTAFLNQLIGEVLEVSGELNIIRAHRTFNERLDPRPIIATFLNNATKRRVLQAAWSKKEVTF